jgi:hypothetical protein
MVGSFRLLLAVVVGFVLGCVVNMGLVMISGKVIPPPEGADITTMEGLKKSIHLFEPKHFVFPFLAHAVGTVAGAAVAAAIAPGKSKIAALIVGGLFLAGGIANFAMLPSPVWFIILDLAIAYLPTAFLGLAIARRFTSRSVATTS